MSTYVTPGYTETALLWDQEDGTLTTTHKPAPHESDTFRVHWGVDHYLNLPAGLRAETTNRYINALRPIITKLAEYATMEHIPADFYDTGDRYKIVYSDGHEPYMDALDQITNRGHDDFELRHRAERDLGADPGYYTPSKTAVEARMRQIDTDRIRSLIVDGDTSYTTAGTGRRYTTIRMDLNTGHLSAHTADDKAPGENVREWQVSPLNSRQANKLMRLVGDEALRVANPTAPGVIASDAWELLDSTLTSHLIGEDEVTKHMDEHGIKDTPSRRERALRAVTNTRFQGW